MADKNIKIVFDPTDGVGKWHDRFTRLKSQTIHKLTDPITNVYLDAIENTIKNTPTTSGESRAGWAKPLEVEGRSLAAVVTPEMGILSTKDVQPTEDVLRKGMEKSIYRKEIEDKSINLETINATPGAVYTEYGDSRTPPTAAVRQAAMGLVEDAKEAITNTLKDVARGTK
jgi:hypothetical protein